MSEIEFKKDYGYPPAAPFWLVWNESGWAPRFKHFDRDSAETEAARLAGECPGSSFHVLAVMSTVSTNIKVVGARFDPSRAPARVAEDIEPAPIPEAEASETPPGWRPTFLDGPPADEAAVADERPF